MEEFGVRISRNQAHKASKGKPIQLAHSQLSGDSNIKLKLSQANARKVQRAVRHQRGCRLILSPEELSGSGIFDLLKSGWDWLSKNVIQTPFYQKNIRPIARELVKTGVSSVPVLGDIAKPGVEWLGEKSQAFGMRGRGKAGLKSDRSDFLSPAHPTYQNKQPATPPGVPSKGGSFRLSSGRGKKCPTCPTCGGSFRVN
jgi:hypothetical protein